jgi:hypothetical protein
MFLLLNENRGGGLTPTGLVFFALATLYQMVVGVSSFSKNLTFLRTWIEVNFI